jgi:hypothetical protein
MIAPLAGHFTLAQVLEQIKNTLWIMARLIQLCDFVTNNGKRFHGRAGKPGAPALALNCLGETALKRACMAVYRLFKNEPFEPEAISTMTRAYAEVCHMLGVSDRDQHETNAVAKTVIEFAQRGARDPVRLRDCVLQALRN